MFTRNFNLLVATNIILGMALPMLIVLGALAGASLTPVPALATAVLSVQMLGGIVITLPLSLLMAAIGRKRGLIYVALLACAGGLVGAWAMSNESFIVLCIAHFMLGGALVGVNFIRFAASESVNSQYKANALSLLLASGLIAALLGPAVFDASKDSWAGFEYAGAYLAITLLGLLGCLPVLLISHDLSTERTEHVDSAASPARSVMDIMRDSKVIVAITIAAVAQAVMVLLMVPTPLAMIDSGFISTDASDVIRWHVVAMFAPGLITGTLIKRFGVMMVITVGLGLLIIAACVALAGIERGHFYVSMVLLGVGWNFGYIGGTHLLEQSIADNEKGAIQGVNDTLLAASSALASVASGAIYMGAGWNMVSYIAIAALAVGGFFVILILRTFSAIQASRCS